MIEAVASADSLQPKNDIVKLLATSECTKFATVIAMKCYFILCSPGTLPLCSVE